MHDIIYLAGSITGCTHQETVSWRDEFTHRMKGTGVKCVSPMRGKSHLKLLDGPIRGSMDDIACCARSIMTRDRFDCTRATLIVANLHQDYMAKDGKPSLGTIIELGWADANRIPIIAIIDEHGPYEHPMLDEAIGFRVGSIHEAAEMAKLILVSES